VPLQRVPRGATLSAAAAAAGYLFAAGRLSAGVRRRLEVQDGAHARDIDLAALELRYIARNVKPARARELALEALDRRPRR
jgi:hypothetical protein